MDRAIGGVDGRGGRDSAYFLSFPWIEQSGMYMAFHQDSNTRSIQGRCSNITGPDRVYVAVLMKYPVESQLLQIWSFH